MASEIDGLHYFVILVTMAGATLVTLAGAVFLIRYRRREREPQKVYPNAMRQLPLVFEGLSLALLFGLFLVWWVIGARQFMTLRIAPENAMDVYVTGKQWMWKFAYPEGNSSVAVLYVPTGQAVRLIMTSRDVIHSFYVPEFRIKQDVLPGRYTTVWFEATAPGAYQILCTEYCGQGHSTMRGSVVALSPGDYARWRSFDSAARDGDREVGAEERAPLEAARPDMLSLARVGERVAAEQGCLRCHTIDGSPHIGPTWAGAYGQRVALEGDGEVLLDAAYITESMMDPAVRIHRGFQNVMPSYLGRISPAETAAIIEFIRSLRTRAPAPSGRNGDRPEFAPVTPPEDGGQTR